MLRIDTFQQVWRQYGWGGGKKQTVNYLIVKSDQEDTLLYIDNQLIDTKTGFRCFSVGKEHSWKIECELYHTESAKVTITSEEPVVINKKLRPTYGYLDITSEPENGTTIIIDGRKVGETPFKTNRIASGRHSVKPKKICLGVLNEILILVWAKIQISPLTVLS